MSTEVTEVSRKNPVVAALEKASAATGSDFKYLLNTAMRESGLKADASASTSSASGLFQFVEQTWLSMVKNYGAKYGLGGYANAISKGSDGRYYADNSEDRQAILNLRQNPEVSALMAGEYASQCKNQMECSLGRQVSNGELYAAHFLGAGGASKLIRMAEFSPDAPAANAFPAAAAANKSVFYNADGSAKSASEVYAWATHSAPVVAESVDTPASAHQSTENVSPNYAMAQINYQNQMMASALLSGSNNSAFSARSSGSSWSGFPLSIGYDLLRLFSDDTNLAKRDGIT